MEAISAKRQRALLIELWGLGDAILASGALRALLDAGVEAHMLCKAASRELLAPSFPTAHFIELHAPWTAFRGKYRLWQWPWRELAGVVSRQRRSRFDDAVSVREDPRDHLLMVLSGAARRHGFPRAGSAPLLTHRAVSPRPRVHRVQEWELLISALLGKNADCTPRLDPAQYASALPEEFRRSTLPLVVLHLGAGQPVRRWPAEYFRELVKKMRKYLRFDLVVLSDEDGYGLDILGEEAQSTLHGIRLNALAALLGHADLFLGNDSAPGHLAAALDTPAVVMFGPQLAEWFGPYGTRHLALTRDLCPYRPCFDACRFAERRCLTRLLPDQVWPEIETHFRRGLDDGRLPKDLLRP